MIQQKYIFFYAKTKKHTFIIGVFLYVTTFEGGL